MTSNEKGATFFESAPHDNQTDCQSSVEQARETERRLFLPLAWAELGPVLKPAKFRGKTKRKTRADTIRAKRSQGAVDASLAALLVLATVIGLLLAEVLK